jgi:hypothetical protein
MQKVFINKITNMVEQILKVEKLDELPDDYFSNCYAVIDEEEKINTYNLKYNKETGEFEVVEGILAKDEVIVERTLNLEDFNNLKKENEDLKARLEKVENFLKEGVVNLK